MSACGHDGWQAGCPVCEAEHARAVSLIDGAIARAFGVSRLRLEIDKPIQEEATQRDT